MATIQCKTCGAQIADTILFCGFCGAAVEKDPNAGVGTDSIVPQTETIIKEGFSIKNLNFKKLIISAVVVVVVLAAAAVAFTVLQPAKYEKAKGSVHVEQLDEKVLVITSSNGKIELDGYLMNSKVCFDGTKVAVMIEEEDQSALYLITDKAQLIADDIHDYWFADSGTAVAYTKEYELSDNSAELWLYSDNKSVTITREFSVMNYYSAPCVLSPDGKTVGYATIDDDELRGYIWDGKTHDLGKEIQPIAVSNGAKYIYYIKSGSTYVQKGISGDNREKLGDNIGAFNTNKDLSQVVFNYNGKAYISRNGNRRESLSGELSFIIRPRSTSYSHGGTGSILGISSFADTFYRSQEGTIIIINSKFEANSIVKNVDIISLADDGKTLTYLRNNSIYKVNGSNSNAEPVQIVNGGVNYFVMTSDGGAVYFVNEDSEMFYQKDKNKPVLVTDDFSFNYGAGVGFGLFKGNTMYYISDDELYVSTGTRGKLVGGFEGDVISLSFDIQAIYVSVNDDGDFQTYRSTDGQKFELMN